MSPWRSPAGLILAGSLSATLAVVVGGFAGHPGFVPAYLLRTVAPVLALLVGAMSTHVLARLRRQVDVPGEFDPGGRALFLGLAMLVATLAAWLAFAQGLPAFWTAGFGVARIESGLVLAKPAADPAADAQCRYRLEVSSASMARPLEQCVAEPVWRQVVAGGPVPLHLLVSRLGAEIVGVGDAPGAGQP